MGSRPPWILLESRFADTALACATSHTAYADTKPAKWLSGEGSRTPGFFLNYEAYFLF